MKKLFAFTLIGGIILYYGCKKTSVENRAILTSSEDISVISTARQYFLASVGSLTIDSNNRSLRLESGKTPLWSQARVESFAMGKVVVVPLLYQKPIFLHSLLDPNSMYSINQLSQLILYKDSRNNFHIELLTALPDSNFIRAGNGEFSGIIKVENWQGKQLHEYKYSGNSILEFKSEGIKDKSSTDGAGRVYSTDALPPMQQLTVCYSLDIYVYSVGDPANGVYSTEELGCDTYFFSAGSSSQQISPTPGDYGSIAGGAGGAAGGIGSSTPSVMKSFSVVANKGNNTIGDVKSYNKCFVNSPGTSYSISLVVDQPTPGTNSSYSSTRDNGSSGLNVGHVFLVFQQVQSGNSVIRSMGFYPSGPVTPVTPSSKGSLNDDEQHTFDISITIPVSGSAFMAALTDASNGNSAGYNLNSFNCATWSLAALSAAGISINAPQGTWPFGGGADPGDIGEYIRKIPLLPGWGRNTVGGASSANAGTCN